ncbi:hypothetical protein ACWD6L_24490 [Micromonospora profundi]|uniref:Uncharacterized protein n=1 Tax=Micromonospora profundi TaxID=1420889 RepID=A0AAJ6L2N2_9ACTN|nr:hypothetical protein [Micromonospora profundi]WLS45945.1 hypothetical protein Q3V37_01270 [Micromonospora profundi]
MQPENPYRYTHMLGACQVGKAWAAVDGQGQFATVAVLDGVAASDERWRVAFGNAANALAQAAGGHRYAHANLTAAHPWVAYRAEEGNAPQRLFQSLGMAYQPVPDLPVSAPPMSAPPTSAAPASAPPASAPPVSGVPQQASGAPVSGAPELVAHMPQLPWAVHTNPVSGQPVSSPSQPVSGAPGSPVPSQSPAPATHSPAPATHSPAPVTYGPATYSSASASASASDGLPPQSPSQDPFGGTGRRIAPVQRPPQRPKWLLAVAAVVLVLAGGTAGFFVGGVNRSDDEPEAPAPNASLAPFEATQFSINKTKFDGDLAPLAEPWLAAAGGCAVDTEVGGPPLPADERRHVFCRYGGASVHFALYPAKAEKDAARAYRQQLNLAGGALAPGLREATRTTGGVTGAPGSYVEYAFKGGDGRTVCGVWWDRDDVNGAFYVETLCEAGIAGNWDALRDLWRRNS